MPSAPQTLALCLAAVCALMAAMTDLRSRRIPNWLTGPAMLTGLSGHLLLGGWHSAADSLLALALGGGLFFVFFAAGGMGAGDVKLMAAVGALAGLAPMRDLLVLTALLGAALALGLATLRGRLRQTLGNSFTVLAHHHAHGLEPHPELHARNGDLLRLPYAVPIACGTVTTLALHLHGGFQ